LILAKAQFDDAIHNSPLLETNPDLARKPASLLLAKFDDPTNPTVNPSSNGSYLVMGQTVYYMKNWYVLDYENAILVNYAKFTCSLGGRDEEDASPTFAFGRLNSPALTEPVPVFPTNVPGCNNAVSSDVGSIIETESGAVFIVLKQACNGGLSVDVQYVLTDGAFRKDIIFDGSSNPNDVETSLLTSPSECDGYLYIPFVDQAPKTGFETSPADRIVPVSDTGVTDNFQSSYLTVPDSIGGLTGQGALGLPTQR